MYCLSSKVSTSKIKDSGRTPSWRFVPLRISPVPFLETSGHHFFSKIQLKFILTVFTCSFFKNVTIFRANLAPKFFIFLSPCAIYMSNHTYQPILQNFISRILISLVNETDKKQTSCQYFTHIVAIGMIQRGLRFFQTNIFLHHHHHVPEGLGMLSCSLILKMKLVPPSLPRSSYVSSSFWFILYCLFW